MVVVVVVSFPFLSLVPSPIVFSFDFRLVLARLCLLLYETQTKLIRTEKTAPASQARIMKDVPLRVYFSNELEVHFLWNVYISLDILQGKETYFLYVFLLVLCRYFSVHLSKDIRQWLKTAFNHRGITQQEFYTGMPAPPREYTSSLKDGSPCTNSLNKNKFKFTYALTRNIDQNCV